MTYVGPHAIHTVYPRLTFSKRALIPRQPYHDEESQAAKRRPDNYDGIVGVQMNRLLADGFDVQYYCAWDPLPCGDACGVAQNSIQSRTAFHLSYSQPLGNDFPGHNIRFVLRTECRNMFCDNFEDVMYVLVPPMISISQLIHSRVSALTGLLGRRETVLAWALSIVLYLPHRQLVSSRFFLYL